MNFINLNKGSFFSGLTSGQDKFMCTQKSDDAMLSDSMHCSLYWVLFVNFLRIEMLQALTCLIFVNLRKLLAYQRMEYHVILKTPLGLMPPLKLWETF